MAVSVRRERLDDGKEKDGMQFNYRVTFRTSQVSVTHLIAFSSLRLVLNQQQTVMNAWQEKAA